MLGCHCWQRKASFEKPADCRQPGRAKRPPCAGLLRLNGFLRPGAVETGPAFQFLLDPFDASSGDVVKYPLKPDCSSKLLCYDTNRGVSQGNEQRAERIVGNDPPRVNPCFCSFIWRLRCDLPLVTAVCPYIVIRPMRPLCHNNLGKTLTDRGGASRPPDIRLMLPFFKGPCASDSSSVKAFAGQLLRDRPRPSWAACDSK